MNQDDPIRQEMEVLLATLTEASLSVDQRARLGELLREHPEARVLYQHYVQLHVMLEWEAGALIGEADATRVLHELMRMESAAEAEIVHAEAPFHTPGRKQPGFAGTWSFMTSSPAVWGSLAAVLVLALGLLAVLAFQGPGTTQTLTVRTPDSFPAAAEQPKAVATLTAERDARWQFEPGTFSPSVGEKLNAGQRLTLTEGFAEITTNRGAVAILEAPATVELLDSDNAIHLHAGKLVGICKTESSKGFIVYTPGIDVLDLGTEFGVQFDGVGTTVEVFTGSVVVGTESQRNHALGTTVESGYTAISTDRSTVSISDSLPSQTRFAYRDIFERRQRWHDYRDQLLRNPALVAYYTFEEPVDGTLLESRGKMRFNGEIEGPRWDQGRFPGKHGLRFAGPGSGDRVELSAEASDAMNFNGSFTVAVWFRAEPFTSKWQSIITKGESSWRLQSNTLWKLHPQRDSDDYEPTALNFGHDDISFEMVPGLPGLTPVDDGTWRQVVIVFEAHGTFGVKHLYINGEADAEPQQASLLPRTLDPVWIGGNSTLPDGREFAGVIDEVAIFNRALTAREVQELYQGGAPIP